MELKEINELENNNYILYEYINILIFSYKNFFLFITELLIFNSLFCFYNTNIFTVLALINK